jgi:hypothetical protein
MTLMTKISAFFLAMMIAASAYAQGSPATMIMPNILINGNHVWDQRNEGNTVTQNDGVYMDDGWKLRKALTSATTNGVQALIADAPTGFQYSDRITIGTGASLATTDELAIAQNIEGPVFRNTPWGVVGAPNLSVSIWLKSSVSGAIIDIAIQNSAQSRSYVSECTLSTTVWSKCQFTVPGDTTGTWLSGYTNIGMRFWVMAGCGASFQGTANTWTASDIRCTSNQTNIAATSAATFQLG